MNTPEIFNSKLGLSKSEFSLLIDLLHFTYDHKDHLFILAKNSSLFLDYFEDDEECADRNPEIVFEEIPGLIESLQMFHIPEIAAEIKNRYAHLKKEHLRQALKLASNSL